MIEKTATILLTTLVLSTRGKTCIEESAERTGTGDVTISDVGILYSEDITSEHRLAKVDFMTSSSGELTGI